MDKFRMADVISLLDIPSPPQDRSSYYVQCPYCDSKPHERHLNINLRKEVFRCPKCGVNGGMFDLYALFTGIPRKKVRDELIRRIGMPETIKRKDKPLQKSDECQLADINVRHAAYSALLANLSLAPDHKQNLLDRGLSENDIDRLGYRTTPVIGMQAIAKKLCSAGLSLKGVPGFYRDGDAWTFVYEQRGILIPVRDTMGQIQGLQIRRDNVEKRKFRWISSAERPDGCRAMGWTHVSGEPGQKIILTEGPMKADVINALCGLSVLAVPGVNALTTLRESLIELRERGLMEIMTAFDMDFLTNPNVQNGYKSLLALLDDMKFRYGTYIWDPQYKGLDDYIWTLCKGLTS